MCVCVRTSELLPPRRDPICSVEFFLLRDFSTTFWTIVPFFGKLTAHMCECLTVLLSTRMCPSESVTVFVFRISPNSRSVQAANQPPHWAQDSLCGSVLPANSHLPAKNLLTPPMTGKGENV